MKYVTASREDFIPEYLRLPDGRTFLTHDLLKIAKKNYKSYAIKNSAKFYYSEPKVSKTVESRKEQYEHLVNSKISEIAKEFCITETQAWYKIKYAHTALKLDSPIKAHFK